jgi:hypothetical protein
MPKIFISYRRDDVGADALNIRDRLASAYGERNVFMDIDKLTAGQRFDRALEAALGQCDVFLAIIGPRWLPILKERQAANVRDFVCEEIASALSRGILVIPVTINRAPLPHANDLPGDIRQLVLHQKHDVSFERIGRDVDDLKAAIRAGAPPKSRSLKRPFWIASLALVAVAAIAALAGIYGHSSRPSPTTERQEVVATDVCANGASLACLRSGSIPGLVATDLRNLSCTGEKVSSSDELKWKGIWTTSVYSYTPGVSGQGGGLENEILRIGGWGDLYYALMHFDVPKLAGPAKLATIFLYAKQDEGEPVGMALDRITQPWGWRLGDRLWWKDKPPATLVGNIPPPQPGKWYAIDITGLFEDWRGGRSGNYGIQLRPLANNRNFNAFHSPYSPEREKRPQLLVCT